MRNKNDFNSQHGSGSWNVSQFIKQLYDFLAGMGKYKIVVRGTNSSAIRKLSQNQYMPRYCIYVLIENGKDVIVITLENISEIFQFVQK